MAQRRMFSQRIVGSDPFLDMPTSSRELYFHLGIYADDDGFISPKKVIRMVGSSEDDLKILITKNFVIPFESGVVVITNWKENNYIQKDRYQETVYQKEYQELTCIQNVYKLDTQVRLGKDRIELDNTSPLIAGQKKNMKNTWKYNENKHGTDYEDVVDADSGTLRKEGSGNSKMKELIDWATKRRGSPFINLTKQYKALGVCKRNKIGVSSIKERWQELEQDNFYQTNGFDFMSVVSTFDKRPPKQHG